MEIREKLLSVAKKATDMLVSHGSEGACARASYTETEEFNVDGGEFSLLRTVISQSIELDVIKGKRYATVSLNKIDDDSVEAAVRECLLSAEAADEDGHRRIAPDMGSRIFENDCTECDKDLFFDRINELCADIKERHPLIIVEQMIGRHRKRLSAYVNSSGSQFICDRGSYELDLMYSAHRGEESTSFFSDGFITDTLDTRFIEMCEVDKNLSDVENQLGATPFDGKFTGVAVLTPSALGGFIYDLYSRFLSGSSVMSKSTPWLNSTGERVVDERITLSALPDGRAITPSPYSMDGYLNENCAFIENGILKTLAVSDYVARKCGYERAKSSFSSISLSNGDTPLADIISKIDKGIVVGRFSGGETSANGDFAGVAKNSFLIENGKITAPLTETMISGNLSQIFNSVINISSETVFDGSTSMPYMAVGNVTVSGK